MYNRILLAVDGSDNALRAAYEAIKLATLSENPLIEVVYVISPAKASKDTLDNPTDRDRERLREEHIARTEALLREAELDYSILMFHGDPAQTLIDYEKEGRFDLLVLGSRGLNPIQKFLLGSVSSKVIEKAGCPVLVVK